MANARFYSVTSGRRSRSQYCLHILWILLCLVPTTSSFPGFLDRLQRQRQELELQQRLQQQNPRVVDLSHTIGADTLAWPGFPGVNFTNLVKGIVPAGGDGFWLEANWFSIAEHTGTHLDAPAHFVEGGEHLHELPLDRFFGAGVKVDARQPASEDPNYQLGTEALQAWEEENGRIPDQSVVLVNFGWDTRWPDRQQYFNSPTPDDGRTLRFPGINPEALRWLVQNRNIKMIGVDVPSVDFGQNTDFAGHRYLCANRVPFVESLANLNQLPPKGMTVYSVPLRLVGGSGVPVRAFAIINGASDLKKNVLSLFFAVIVSRLLVRSAL